MATGKPVTALVKLLFDEYKIPANYDILFLNSKGDKVGESYDIDCEDVDKTLEPFFELLKKYEHSFPDKDDKSWPKEIRELIEGPEEDSENYERFATTIFVEHPHTMTLDEAFSLMQHITRSSFHITYDNIEYRITDVGSFLLYRHEIGIWPDSPYNTMEATGVFRFIIEELHLPELYPSLSPYDKNAVVNCLAAQFFPPLNRLPPYLKLMVAGHVVVVCPKYQTPLLSG